MRFIMIPLAIHVSLLSLKISKCLIEKDLQALKNAPGSTRTYCSTGNSVHYYVAAWMGGEFGENGYMDKLAAWLFDWNCHNDVC